MTGGKPRTSETEVRATCLLHGGFDLLKAKLIDLRDSLPELQRDLGYLQLIDEFIREDEFGLALESICDFLLEPQIPPPGNTTIARVESLHRLMAVEDACLAGGAYSAALCAVCGRV
jgi:hypothetical protein